MAAVYSVRLKSILISFKLPLKTAAGGSVAIRRRMKGTVLGPCHMAAL